MQKHTVSTDPESTISERIELLKWKDEDVQGGGNTSSMTRRAATNHHHHRQHPPEVRMAMAIPQSENKGRMMHMDFPSIF